MDEVQLFLNGQRMSPGFIYAPYIPDYKPITWEMPTEGLHNAEPLLAYVIEGEAMYNRHSNKVITVNKAELLESLKKHREEHKKAFAISMQGYRVAMVMELKKKLEAAENNLDVDHTIKLPRPVNHTVDYDRAIQVVELSVGDTFEVTVAEIECFINDNWDWKQTFAMTNKMYVDALSAVHS